MIKTRHKSLAESSHTKGARTLESIRLTFLHPFPLLIGFYERWDDFHHILSTFRTDVRESCVCASIVDIYKNVSSVFDTRHLSLVVPLFPVRYNKKCVFIAQTINENERPSVHPRWLSQSSESIDVRPIIPQSGIVASIDLGTNTRWPREESLLLCAVCCDVL